MKTTFNLRLRHILLMFNKHNVTQTHFNHFYSSFYGEKTKVQYLGKRWRYSTVKVNQIFARLIFHARVFHSICHFNVKKVGRNRKKKITENNLTVSIIIWNTSIYFSVYVWSWIVVFESFSFLLSYNRIRKLYKFLFSSLPIAQNS
jgi:hypothetical protein